jgi:hypothetical protein
LQLFACQDDWTGLEAGFGEAGEEEEGEEESVEESLGGGREGGKE